MRGPVLFFGAGAAKCQAVLGDHLNAVFLQSAITPSARTVGALATPAFEAGQFENVATFEPFYLKDFMITAPKKVVM